MKNNTISSAFLQTITRVLMSALALMLISCGDDSSDSSNPQTATPPVGYWKGTSSEFLDTTAEETRGMIFKHNDKYHLSLSIGQSNPKTSLSELTITGLEASSAQCSAASNQVTSCAIKGVFDGPTGAFLATYSYTLAGVDTIFTFSIQSQQTTQNKMILPTQQVVFTDKVRNATIYITQASLVHLVASQSQIFSSPNITITERMLSASKVGKGYFWASSIEHLSDDVSQIFSVFMSNNVNLSQHGSSAGWAYYVSTNTVVPAYNAGKKWYEDGVSSNIGATNCSSCHGRSGEGGVGPALKGSAKAQSDRAIEAMLTGPGFMASFSTQSNTVLSQLATYLRHAWGNSPTGPTTYVATEDEVQAKR